jgi:hypothetical protein
MADLAQIAQSGVDPISGSYLSAERRKAIFARSRNVSSNIFRRGGALVPINRQPDDGALALVQTQSQTITSLQEQVNSLRVRDEGSLALVQNQSQTITSLQEQVNSLRTKVNNFDEVIRIQTQTIGGVQQQIGGLSTEVTDFSGALSRITDVIAYDSVLEQNRTKQEQEEQRRATEQGLRVGRESILEKAIQGALIAPVQKIAQKAQSILDKVKEFFTILFVGWFANKGIETLKALSEGNGKKLEEIRDNVLKGLGIAAGTLFLLNGGFFAIASTITRLSLKIGGWLLKNTIGRFFGALGKLLTSAGSAIVSTAKAGVAAITGSGAKAAASVEAKVATKAGTEVAAKTATKVGAETAAKGAGKLGSRLVPGLQTIAGIGFGSYELSQGRPISAAFDFGSAIPGPIGWAFLAGGVGYALAGSPGQGKPKEKTSPKTAVTPQTPVVSKNKTPNAPAPAADNGQSFNQTMNDLTSQASKIDWTKPAQFGEVNMDPEQGTPAQVSSQPAQADIKTPAQTSKIATLPLNVGPAPEPTPNVVYKRIGSPAQQQSGAAPTGGSVNEVPAISASNPDNFYVLYSQVNYNVVT